MRPEPRWRGYVVGFEGVAVAYGLVALVAGHYVPGTLVAGYTLARLLSAEAAGAFAGTPTWAPPLPAAQPTAQPVALAPVYPSEPAYLPPPAPVAAVSARAAAGGDDGPARQVAGLRSHTGPVSQPSTCAVCGTSVEERPATWSLQVSDRGATWLCERCTRDNLRSIEGKLDEAWW
jgi:hypothetical protein